MKNFFEQQEQARQRTRWLVVLMVLAVLALSAALYVVSLPLAWQQAGWQQALWQGPRWWMPEWLGLIVLGTAAFVGIASGGRALTLRHGGGRNVAEMLGGRLIPHETTDPLEKRLVNVVEEMSIAAGVPMPLVFVLDNEPGINAFAAGYSLKDAVVAVTRGTLEQLSRDELQGVMAHEFSHILNGDMRLNIRLMGIVFGIVCISMVGRFLMQAGASRGVSRRRDNDNSGVAILVLGLGMLVVGLIGHWMGRLIQAAISRQREYLADASAVQFTRNPAGIAGALRKIAGLGTGSHVEASRAGEARHFFFGDPMPHSLLNLFATHPPLADRIRRIDPDGSAEMQLAPSSSHASFGSAASLGGLAGGLASGIASPNSMRDIPPDTESSALSRPLGASAGHADELPIATARSMLGECPSALLDAAGNPFSAGALVQALVLSGESTVRALQLHAIETLSSAALRRETERLSAWTENLGRSQKLPLAMLCVAALRQFGNEQRRNFQRTLQALIEADGAIEVFEYTLLQLLAEPTDRGDGRSAHRAVGAKSPSIKSLTQVSDECHLLLSALAWAGSRQPQAAREAYQTATLRLQGLGALASEPLQWQPRLLAGLGMALERLRGCTPPLRQRLVDACTHVVLADRDVNTDEAELLRVVCLHLECPMPLAASWGA